MSLLQKIQRFAGAMFAPAMLFAFAAVIIGLGTLFTSSVIIGPLANEGTTWYNVWSVLLAGGWTVFNQLPLLFAIALPIGLAHRQAARCCMESLVSYLTFNYFINAILSAWGSELGVDFSAEVGNSSGLALIGGIKTLDLGMVGALGVSGIVIVLHNRLFDKKLPDWLGVFSGSTFVYLVAFFVMIPLAFLTCLIWPKIQIVIRAFQVFIANSGAAGVATFVFSERVLIPFGLHHLLYAPLYYDNAVVQGGIYAAWAKALPDLASSTAQLSELAPWASLTATGWSKVFGIPGISAAFYATAKPGRRKKLLALLISITLTSVLCGVTEPIEFTFLFIAPPLFLVHAALSALLSTTMNLCGVVGVFSGGLIEMSSLNFIPLAATHASTYLTAIPIGLSFTCIYFFVFKFLILKFDFKTPGREDDFDQSIRYGTKEEYQSSKNKKRISKSKQAAGPSDDRDTLATNILDLLGGKENIVDITSCVTRLRITVSDPELVADDQAFKKIGTMDVAKKDKAVQVIVGMSVTQVCDHLQDLAGLEQ